MLAQDEAQVFLFTFRNNGGQMDEPLVEVFVEQLADYDPSVAEGAYRRSWFGTRESLPAVMDALGFEAMDATQVLAALRDLRDADRRLEVTPDQLEKAGFREVAAEA